MRATLTPLCYISGVDVDRDFPGTLRVGIEEHRPAAYALAGSRWYVIADDGHVICDVTRAKIARGGSEAGADSAAAAPEQTAAAVSAATVAEATATVGAANVAAGLPAPSGKAARLIAALLAGPPDAALRLPRLAAAGPVTVGTTLGDTGARAALPVLADLPRTLRDRLAVVETTSQGQLTLRFSGGPVVVWGGAERSLAKTLALTVVLDRYERASQDCVFVDVSIPDRVLARPVLK
ncbi:MAG: cell division protein FtsQ/DivIB [Actinobacteria bacterium]|nr:cell division protein FtsQ/DivIB [Actinomycetota bacterium]